MYWYYVKAGLNRLSDNYISTGITSNESIPLKHEYHFSIWSPVCLSLPKHTVVSFIVVDDSFRGLTDNKMFFYIKGPSWA
jgi:hypothetical protein